MHNRRNFLRQTGLAAAALGLAPLKILGSESRDLVTSPPENSPVWRLNANENPYGPSLRARMAMTPSIDTSNRYPWDMTKQLLTAIAQKNRLADANVCIGAGSSELLSVIVQYVSREKGSFVLANPTFGHWAAAAEFLGLKKIAVPLDKDKRHDLKAMLAAINDDVKMVYICNPNNPTGTVCKREGLVSFIGEASKKALVVVDEAYIEYSGEQSVSDLVTGNGNLLVVRTFSKIYGMAGARVGYAMGHSETIEKLSNQQAWMNGSVGITSLTGARVSLQDDNFVNSCVDFNRKTRQYTIDNLEKLGMKCIPSTTNFVYFSLKDYKKDYFGQLKVYNILGTYIYEEDGKWTRITIGTMAEMEYFIAALG